MIAAIDVSTFGDRFYEKAGEATAFVQEKPEVFDEPYRGMQSESGGVLGMLEVIAVFATLADSVVAHRIYRQGVAAVVQVLLYQCESHSCYQ